MDAEVNPGAGSVLVDRVSEWLMSQALGEGEIEPIFEGCCNRLAAAGVPLVRSFLSFRTLHPLFASVTLYWRRGQELNVTEVRHGEAFTSEQWLASPLHHMLQTRIPYLRRRLRGEEAQLDFPILEELCEQGATDYLAYMVAFAADDEPGPHPDGILGSWATERASGFSDADLRALVRVQRRLAVACKVQIKKGVTRNVLATYLGHGAGEQVLEGQIKRGDGQRIYAVVWYSDMRRSTEYADSMPPEDFLLLVNTYFECTAGAVMAHRGEVLRFIGDAVLAIFPIGRGKSAKAAARQAMRAARDAERHVDAINARRAAEGEVCIDFGLGLHVGEVMFGNIGVPERLEFSVIGPAANEVARLESLTKRLRRRVVVSGELARHLPLQWQSLGMHELRGVGQPVEVFAPPQSQAVPP